MERASTRNRRKRPPPTHREFQDAFGSDVFEMHFPRSRDGTPDASREQSATLETQEEAAVAVPGPASTAVESIITERETPIDAYGAGSSTSDDEQIWGRDTTLIVGSPQEEEPATAAAPVESQITATVNDREAPGAASPEKETVEDKPESCSEPTVAESEPAPAPSAPTATPPSAKERHRPEETETAAPIQTEPLFIPAPQQQQQQQQAPQEQPHLPEESSGSSSGEKGTSSPPPTPPPKKESSNRLPQPSGDHGTYYLSSGSGSGSFAAATTERSNLTPNNNNNNNNNNNATTGGGEGNGSAPDCSPPAGHVERVSSTQQMSPNRHSAGSVASSSGGGPRVSKKLVRRTPNGTPHGSTSGLTSTSPVLQTSGTSNPPPGPNLLSEISAGSFMTNSTAASSTTSFPNVQGTHNSSQQPQSYPVPFQISAIEEIEPVVMSYRSSTRHTPVQENGQQHHHRQNQPEPQQQQVQPGQPQPQFYFFPSPGQPQPLQSQLYPISGNGSTQYSQIDEANFRTNDTAPDYKNHHHDTEQSTFMHPGQQQQDQQQQIINHGVCVLCKDKKSGIIFRPCNHVCCCPECAFTRDACPVCGSHIQESGDAPPPVPQCGNSHQQQQWQATQPPPPISLHQHPANNDPYFAPGPNNGSSDQLHPMASSNSIPCTVMSTTLPYGSAVNDGSSPLSLSKEKKKKSKHEKHEKKEKKKSKKEKSKNHSTTPRRGGATPNDLTIPVPDASVREDTAIFPGTPLPLDSAKKNKKGSPDPSVPPQGKPAASSNLLTAEYSKEGFGGMDNNSKMHSSFVFTNVDTAPGAGAESEEDPDDIATWGVSKLTSSTVLAMEYDVADVKSEDYDSGQEGGMNVDTKQRSNVAGDPSPLVPTSRNILADHHSAPKTSGGVLRSDPGASSKDGSVSFNIGKGEQAGERSAPPSSMLNNTVGKKASFMVLKAASIFSSKKPTWTGQHESTTGAGMAGAGAWGDSGGIIRVATVPVRDDNTKRPDMEIEAMKINLQVKTTTQEYVSKAKKKRRKKICIGVLVGLLLAGVIVVVVLIVMNIIVIG